MSDPFMTLKFAQGLSKSPSPMSILSSGMVDAAQINQAARAERNAQALAQGQQQSYQAAFQRYMADPSAENRAALMQRSQAIGKFDETASTVEAVDQQRAQEAEAARQAALKEDYISKANAFKENQSADNLFAASQAAQELGMLDEFTEMVGGFEDAQQGAIVDQLLGAFSALDTNNGELALEIAERNAAAYDEVENDTLSNVWDRAADLIERGDISGAKRALAIHASTMEQGREAITGMNAFFGEERERSAEERAAEQMKIKLIELGLGQEFDQEELDRLTQVAANDPELGDVAAEILRYANLVDAGVAMDPIETRELELKLQDRWREYNEKLDGVKVSHTGLQNIYEDIQTNGGGVGWVDPNTFEVVEKGTRGAIEVEGIRHIAAMNLFQRMIDPATVREGDVDLIRSANSLIDRIKTGLEGLRTGARISDNQLAQMLETARSLEQANQKWVDEEAYPALESMVSTTPGAIWDNVFKGYTPPDERPGMNETRDRHQAAMNYLLEGVSDPDEISAVRSSRDVEELERNYPGLMEGFEYTPAKRVEPSELPQSQLARLRSHIIAANRGQGYWTKEREDWVQSATAEQIADRYENGYNAFVGGMGDTTGEVFDVFGVNGGN